MGGIWKFDTTPQCHNMGTLPPRYTAASHDAVQHSTAPGDLMRRSTAACLLAATAILLAGCSVPDAEPGSSAAAPVDGSPDSPHVSSAAQKLADLDGSTRDAGDYQKALDAWAKRCNESPEKLAGYAYATVDDLQKHGINDETEYSALVHLKGSIPAGTKMNCEDVAAAYLVLRENGQS